MSFRSVLDLLSTPGALRALFAYKLFSINSFKLVKRLASAGVVPMSVIDVGANVGQFSVAISHEFPDAAIFPIEPDVNTVRILRANLPARISDNIACTAVGDSDGEVIFRVNTDSQVSSILPLGEDRRRSFPGSVVMHEVSVPISSLDALFYSKSLPKPILLKIDVQGYEDRVINGAFHLLREVSWVVIEVSFARLYDGEKAFMSIVDLLAKHGFRFVRPLNFHQAGKSLDIIEMDALFEHVD